MWQKILTVLLALVMVLALTACGEEEGLPSAKEIVDGVIESFDVIKTYQFDLDMTMDVDGETEGEAFKQIMTMDNNGTLDLENMQMKADLNLITKMVAPEEDEFEMGVEAYIIGGMVYARPEAPGEEPMWIKSEAPAEYWEIMKGVSGLENYKELLQTAKVKVLGSENVKGVDCYVLQLTPEMAELYQIAMEPSGGSGTGGMLPPVPEELLEEMFRSFSVKQWIAKDTNFLMKAEIDMVIESTPELMGYLEQDVDVSMDITVIFLAYNYNQPVSIIVPQEALEATEMPTEYGY